MKNIFYGTKINSIFSSKPTLRNSTSRVPFSNTSNSLVANNFILTTLCDFISSVIRIGSNPQVVRITAIPYIARMQNALVFRYRAACQYVGKAVSQPLASLIAERSVLMSVDATSPKPTRFSFGNFRPEILGFMHGHSVILVDQMHRSNSPLR